MADDRQLSFILGLLGGVFALGSGVMMLVMGALFSTFFGFASGMRVPGAFFGLFGALGFLGLAGGVVMLVSALRLRNATPADARNLCIALVVGGGLALVGGNALAAGLGIVAGALPLARGASA